MTKTKKRFKNFLDAIYYGLIAGNEKKECLWGFNRFFIWVRGIIVLCMWILLVAYFSTISVSGAVAFQFILECLFLALLIITEQQSDAWKKCLAAWTQPEAKMQQKESAVKHKNLSRMKKFIARLIFCYILISTIIMCLCLGEMTVLMTVISSIM